MNEARGEGETSRNLAFDGAWETVGHALHDLRTPLSAMSGWLEVLEARADSSDPIVSRSIAGLRRAVDDQAALLDSYGVVSRQHRQWPSACARRTLFDVLVASISRLEGDAASILEPLRAMAADALDPLAGSDGADADDEALLCDDAGDRLIDACGLLLRLLAAATGAKGVLAFRREPGSLAIHCSVRDEPDEERPDGQLDGLIAFCTAGDGASGSTSGSAVARKAHLNPAMLWSGRAVLARCGIGARLSTVDERKRFVLTLTTDLRRPV